MIGGNRRNTFPCDRPHDDRVKQGSRFRVNFPAALLP
jgi:hypothetical protein